MLGEAASGALLSLASRGLIAAGNPPWVPELFEDENEGPRWSSEISSTPINHLVIRGVSSSAGESGTLGKGRFLSPDVLGGKPEDQQTWNRYAYARNNPIKFVDPNGMEFGYPGQQQELNSVLASQEFARGGEICRECNPSGVPIANHSATDPAADFVSAFVPTNAGDLAITRTANQRFLDRLVSRGDEVVLTTRISKVRPGSWTEREIRYLLSRGYRVDETGRRLLPPR